LRTSGGKARNGMNSAQCARYNLTIAGSAAERRFCSLEKPRSVTQTILARVQSRISSLTWRISAWSVTSLVMPYRARKRAA